ncbi:insulin receptor-like isoform X3 [Cherax quadricarinatus]|uniref:insulin receptor-like isoform X3 n=1 Tax=Cherax quadricarinatus TaxID=27406 RepID=UPI00387E8DA4
MCIYAQCEEDGNCTTRLSSLNTQCTYHGYCFQGEECHSECVGGCTCLHSATCCVACRHYQDGNTCLPACSPTSLNSVHHLGYRCVSEEWCRRSGWRVDQEYLVHDQEYLVHDQEYLVHDQEYLVHDTTKFILTCQGVMGTGNYSKTCRGATITSSDPGRSLRDCQRIDGSLNITLAGGWNLTQQLEENLQQLVEVTGYIRVYGSNTLFSLNFLSNLQVIGGQELVHNKYALYMLENEKLQELWDWDQRNQSLRISRGTLFSHYNPSLCPRLLYQLANITGIGRLDDADVTTSSSEDTPPCYGEELPVIAWADKNVGTINVSWKHVYDGRDDRFVIGYYVYYRETSTTVTIFQGRDACNDKLLWERIFLEYKKQESKSVVITGLKPYTRYALYVSVYYIDAKNATRSAIVYVNTSPTNPSPVEEMKVSVAASSHLTLTWLPPAAPNGEIELYEVMYKTVLRPSLSSAFYDRNQVCGEDFERPGGVSKEPVVSHEERTSVSPLHEKVDVSQGEGFNLTQGLNLTRTQTLNHNCCACPLTHTLVSKEDRQHDIEFENYVIRHVYIKSRTVVTEVGARLKRQVPRQAFHTTPTSANDTGDVNKTQMTTANTSTTTTTTANTITTTTTTANITGLHYFTDYQISVRACQAKVENITLCSEWKNLTATTLPDKTRNNILKFVVKLETRQRRLEDQEEHLEEEVLSSGTGPSATSSSNSSSINDSINIIAINSSTSATSSSPSINVSTTRISTSPSSTTYSVNISSTSNATISNTITSNTTTSNTATSATSASPAISITTASSKTSTTSTTTISGSTLLLTWEPPLNPNGPPLAYIIQYSHSDAPQGNSELVYCVLEEEARRSGYSYLLPGLLPGTYVINMKLRSLGGDGHFTTQIIKIPGSYWYWTFLVFFLCGVMLGTCVITVVGCFRRGKRPAGPDTPHYVTHNPNYGELLGDALQEIKKQYIISIDALQIDLDHILGEGCFGIVYNGVLTEPSGSTVKVAVKALSVSASYTEVKRFLQEAVVMQKWLRWQWRLQMEWRIWQARSWCTETWQHATVCWMLTSLSRLVTLASPGTSTLTTIENRVRSSCRYDGWRRSRCIMDAIPPARTSGVTASSCGK